MAKAKTKAAVKSKTAKAPARAAVARVVKAPKKAAAAKPAKAIAAKMIAAKPARPATVKAAATVAVARTASKPPVIAEPRKSEPLTLPVAKPAPVPAPRPLPVARISTGGTSLRADLPPVDGFTLLVDGHFKNRFDDLKHAKAAATELLSKFPMLRVEIYDAASKTRLPT